ncbi:chondroitin sulfate synthase 2 [Vanessa atalanta]|uniref:chondroitin sulfate synthase 2 n=1 Tax=Vanessa atalanta TaxID=42275 RepID=UPI001FCD5EAA|nr:chondroitin sulfate synthase 2 [Vanessa atalanta]
MFSRYVVSQVKHNSYFLVGLGIGLWLALATVPLDEEVTACEPTVTVGAPDEFEPHREERPLGPAGQAGRSVQRPRYYSTELGMRGGLLAGVLSSEDVLETRAAALNQTAARLQPALRFFITASALQAAPGRANVVGFTDTREMLKPFHALKYLADNYLEEYDFFFLVSDTSFVNSRRLTELVSKLSVSQDIYMGTIADDDTHYCTLEGGILLSNSVLRAVHGELDWCVRNSYSPHHHENVGRCVLHAAHLPCAAAVQGENYVSMPIEGIAEPEGGVKRALVEALADAVVAHPALEPEHFYQLHAFVSRVYLERAQAAAARERARAALSARRHPRGFRNASWPPALRDDAGLAPAAPPSRFDHLRWTRFNLTHAYMPDDHRALAPLSSAYREAVDLIVEEVRAWAARRWGVAAGADAVVLEEGAWCWEPPRALRYRLLLRVPRAEGSSALVQVEAARALGAARLAPARYVTESARVLLLLPLPVPHAAALPAFLRRYESVCLQRDANTALTVVVVPTSESPSAEEDAALAAAREALRALGEKHRGAQLEVLLGARGPVEADASEAELQQYAARVALTTAMPRLSRDALFLLSLPHMEFTEDFLNRVRMNTIAGEQWFLPLPFARFASFAHPQFADAHGARATLDTGRFQSRAAPLVLSATRRDYDDAMQAWAARGGAAAPDAAAALSAAPLRAVRAPEPALLLAPRGAPCAGARPAALRCLRRERARGFSALQLGARHSLAKLLLQTQAELA